MREEALHGGGKVILRSLVYVFRLNLRISSRKMKTHVSEDHEI